MNIHDIHVDSNFLGDLNLRPNTNNMLTNYDSVTMPPHARHDYFLGSIMPTNTPASYHIYIQLGLLITCTMSVIPTNCFSNNDNALVICACGSYKFHEIKTIHRKVQFISFFWL